jgi:uncharacterized membrane protein YedE/YeeE
MPDLIYLNTFVLTSAFVVAFVLGFGMQRTQFCSMGAISDVLLMQSWSRARQWCVALAIAVLGTSVMHVSALIDIHQTIYTSAKLLWLSHLLGGILFGIGMSIASGCGAKNLVRLGGGSLKSLIVLLVAGVFAQMTLRGIFAVIRVNSVDQVYLQLPVQQDLASLLHLILPMESSTLGVWISGFFALGLLLFAFKNTEFRQQGQWWISVLVGISILTFWWISGHLGYVAENPNTLEPLFVATNSGRMESASLTAPMAYWLDYLTLFSDTSKTISFAMIISAGIALGSCASAILKREWRLQGFSSVQDTMNHIIGGALMGVGGVTALGCTFGQGLSGMSTLALSSFITVAGFVIGVSLGLRYLERSAN